MKKYIVVKVCVIVNQSEIVASYDSEEEAKEYTKIFNKYYETGGNHLCLLRIKR